MMRETMRTEERIHRRASANELNMKGDERRPKGRHESKKNESAQWKQSRGYSSGWTGHSVDTETEAM